MIFGTNESLAATALLLITSTLLHNVYMVEGTIDLPMTPGGVDLGCAGGFAILTKTGVSTTGATTKITGDMGISPIAATAYTGFGLVLDTTAEYHHSTSSLVDGDIYAADYVAPTNKMLTVAVEDMLAAHTDARTREYSLPKNEYVEISNPTQMGTKNGIIDGMTLKPGVYKWSKINFKDLTFAGGPDDVWIMQVQYIITMDTYGTVNLEGGAQAKNIYWVCTAAVIDVGSHAEGIFLASTLLTFNTESSLNGAALAQSAVTLQFTTINNQAGRGECNIDGVVAAPVVTPAPTDAPTEYDAAPKAATADVTCSDNVVLVKQHGTTPYPIPVAAVTTTTKVKATTEPPVVDAPAASDSVNFLNIGMAGQYAVLSQTGITIGVGPPRFPDAGGTAHEFSINGDVASHPTPTFVPLFGLQISDDQTHYTSDMVNGNIYGYGPEAPEAVNTNTDVLEQATQDVKDAIIYANTLTPDTFAAPSVDLINKTFKAGVYKWTGAILLTGTVTFDGDGDENAVFVMISAAAFSPAAKSKVTLTGGAKAENLFWVLGGALSTGAGSDLYGVVLCGAALTIGANAKWTGALTTSTAYVTIEANAEINKDSVCVGDCALAAGIIEENDSEASEEVATKLSTAAAEAIPPAVEIVSQDTNTVTVRLNQEWTTSLDKSVAIFYEYKENMFTNKCHTAPHALGRDTYDEITITCNVMSPIAYLHICVADDQRNDIVVAGDDATIPKCCHSKDIVPENSPTVCYNLEILCAPECTDTFATKRKLVRLRGAAGSSQHYY